MKVGGYCTAFPDFKLQDFGRWNARWKQFIDIAGKDMDFFTIHLYDFPVLAVNRDTEKAVTWRPLWI